MDDGVCGIERATATIDDRRLRTHNAVNAHACVQCTYLPWPSGLQFCGLLLCDAALDPCPLLAAPRLSRSVVAGGATTRRRHRDRSRLQGAAARRLIVCGVYMCIGMGRLVAVGVGCQFGRSHSGTHPTPKSLNAIAHEEPLWMRCESVRVVGTPSCSSQVNHKHTNKQSISTRLRSIYVSIDGRTGAIDGLIGGSTCSC